MNACVLEENMRWDEVPVSQELPADDGGELCWHCFNTKCKGETALQ